jgi:hypothetical protein
VNPEVSAIVASTKMRNPLAVPRAQKKTRPFFPPACAKAVSAHKSRWDGVNLDSPDHQSHVAYAEIPYEPYVAPLATHPYTPEQQRGKCPEGFPIMLPQVMYEVMFDTMPFNQKELWGNEGTQPFVFSMGDA